MGGTVWYTNKLDQYGSPSESWDGLLPNGKYAPQEVYTWFVKKARFVDGRTEVDWAKINSTQSRTTLVGMVRRKNYEISTSGIGRTGTISIIR